MQLLTHVSNAVSNAMQLLTHVSNAVSNAVSNTVSNALSNAMQLLTHVSNALTARTFKEPKKPTQDMFSVNTNQQHRLTYRRTL
jgi:hypothetical protein